jgi:outer membrane protein assembly factor BamB
VIARPLWLLALAALTSCSAYGPGWSATHADARNTDYSPLPGPDDIELAWQRQLPGNINLGPTFDAKGRVYVTENSTDCNLHVLDPADGSTEWCSAEVDRFASISSPLLDDRGRAFVADGEAMHAFGPDGQLLWERPIEGVPLSAQFTPRGNLLFITHIGNVHVVRRHDGHDVLEPVELIPGATWDPSDGVLSCARGLAACPAANVVALDERSGKLYFTFWAAGAPQAGVRAMRIVEGARPRLEPVWTNDSLPGGSASSPVISRDRSRIYVTDNEGSVHAIDARTGTTAWSTAFGYASGGSPSVSPEGLIMPAGGAGGVVAIRDDGYRGRIVWSRPDLTNRGIPTQMAGNRAYATVRRSGFENDVVVLDTTSGAELDRAPIPGTSIFSVGTTVGPDGTIYVPTLNGRILAYRSR